MINRQLIRPKVVQLTYAYYQNGNNNLDNAEKELMFSMSKGYHLYLKLLSLIVAIAREAQRQYDVEMVKAVRAGRRPPSSRFAENLFAIQLEKNIQLEEFTATQKHQWDDSAEYVRKTLAAMQQSDIYYDYMTAEVTTYDDDRELWRKLYKYFLACDPDLDALLEEQSLYWNDDKEVVDSFVLKTIKRFEQNNGAKQELLPEFRDDEDRTFALKLFRTTLLNADRYRRYISDASLNWDISRLAFMDIIILQIAIAEMLEFPAIPINVTINEYVNIAKLYSTPRSAGYINGMLDNIARRMIDCHEVQKSMPQYFND